VDTPALILLVAFVLGLLFGSFLNVCISRLPKRESIIRPRSRCLECGAAIRWYDNIPVLSWLLLARRCRDCKQPIPLRYPLVELATGLWFAAVAAYCLHASLIGLYTQLTTEARVDLIVTAIGAAILGFLLIGLTVIDWQTNLLPNAFTLWGILIGFLLACVRAGFLGPGEDQVMLPQNHIQLTSVGSDMDTGNVFLTGPEHLVFGRIVAICAAALVLLAIRWLYKALRHREGMGLGDVKLLAMIAAFLGFWPAILSLFFGSILASVYAIALLLRGRATATTRLAFGSFLAGGGLIVALYGAKLIGMYAALFP
jgi:leader peptidase (prepilin peptidase)/N-methyltransferase